MSSQAASTASDIPHPRIASADRTDTALLVPIGGHGWGWSLLARYGLLVSIGYIGWAIPIPGFASGLRRFERFGGPWFNAHFAFLGDSNVHDLVYSLTWPFLLAVLWMFIDRRRKHEVVIHEVARLAARYGLAKTLASYGMEKIFGAQGAWAYEPRYSLAPFGETGAWTSLMLWLGHSTVYEFFAGWVETGCTLLLPFRRTTTLGAMLGVAALVNVCIVNSGHGGTLATITPLYFLPMGLFLLVPEMKRLTQFFLGQRADPPEIAYLHPPLWWTRSGMVAKSLVVPWMLLSANHFYFAVAEDRRSPLGGNYHVERFERNGHDEPIAYEFPARWQDVAIGRQGEEVTVRTIDDTRIRYNAAKSTAGGDHEAEENAQVARTLRSDGDLALEGREVMRPERQVATDYGSASSGDMLFPAGTFDFKHRSGTMHFAHPAPDDVTLSGVIDGDTISAQLRRVPIDSIPLLRHRWYVTAWRARVAEWVRARGLRYPY